MKKETEIIEKCSNEITAEIEKIQTHFKNIISILKEIDYIQRTIKVNLGLFVIDADYYAPTRYFIGRRSTNDEINFHPAFGVKRFNGERCEHNLPLLLKIAEKTEKFLVETGEKISEISIPSVDKIKTFKMYTK